MLEVSYLDLLHEICHQRGHALILTAQHTAAGFAQGSRTVLRHLAVMAPAMCPATHANLKTRAQLVRGGELVASVDLSSLDHDVEAAAELLVQMLTRRQAKAA